MAERSAAMVSVVRKVCRQQPMPAWLCDAQYFASLHSGMPSHMPIDMSVFLWQGLSTELQAYINRQIREDDHHSYNVAVRRGYQMY